MFFVTGNLRWKQRENKKKKRGRKEKMMKNVFRYVIRLNFYQNRIYKIIEQKKLKTNFDLLHKLSLVYPRDKRLFLKWLWQGLWN